MALVFLLGAIVLNMCKEHPLRQSVIWHPDRMPQPPKAPIADNAIQQNITRKGSIFVLPCSASLLSSIWRAAQASCQAVDRLLIRPRDKSWLA